MLSRFRECYRRWCVRRRRRKLVAAYAKVGRIRHGLGPGLSPTMYAYDCLTSEGLLVLVDGELYWTWPDEEHRDDEQLLGNGGPATADGDSI